VEGECVCDCGFVEDRASFACMEWGYAWWPRRRIMECEKSGSSRGMKCSGGGNGGDGGRSWVSGEEDGGNKREEICKRFVCSFGLLRWRANVCVIGVSEEIGQAWHARNSAARGGRARD
jgi:hypothetical protein